MIYRGPFNMARQVRQVAPGQDSIAESLSIPSICAIEFPPDAPEGAYLYLFRLCGIVRRVHAAQTVLGSRYRLQGELLAGRGSDRWAAYSFVVPEAIADQVQACLAEHPPRSTRDRVVVHVDFDLWARKRLDLALGHELICQGRAYVPEPLSSLAALSFARPVLPEPSDLLE
jgi:hypothetical protein